MSHPSQTLKDYYLYGMIIELPYKGADPRTKGRVIEVSSNIPYLQSRRGYLARHYRRTVPRGPKKYFIQRIICSGTKRIVYVSPFRVNRRVTKP